MSWDYSGDPSASKKDNVRFVIGDTNSQCPFLTDEEITFVLGQVGQSVPQAALRCCESIIGKLSSLRDESVGSVSIQFSQQLKGYTDLLNLLRWRSSLAGGYRAYAGGTSHADVRAVNANPDRVKPAFDRYDEALHPGGTPMDGFSHWERR